MCAHMLVDVRIGNYTLPIATVALSLLIDVVEMHWPSPFADDTNSLTNAFANQPM